MPLKFYITTGNKKAHGLNHGMIAFNSYISKEYRSPFWCFIGREIEKNETVQEAAIRKLYEKTSLLKKEIKLGPIV